ncbi:MAG: retropepsin-like aspartic protease family protein [Pyrinomonadaceae bacterium]
MKRNSIFSLPILLLFFLISASAQSNLDVLYRNHRYFELRDEIKKIKGDTSPSILFYRGAVANKFNQPQTSIALLQEFLKTVKSEANAKTIADAYGILSDDYIKTYQYANAADTLKTLANDFKTVLAPDEIKDHDNDYKLYNAIRNVPPQTVSFGGDTQIQGIRDAAKLLNLPVEANGQQMNFIFDTGANLSTMSVSTANKLGLKTIEADFDVGSTTTARVKSKLAVLPTLKIGNMTIHNAVFLVFEDSALFFQRINFQINAIIGFPIIEAMRQITLTRQDVMTIPAHPQKKISVQNLCLDGLSPLVQGTYNNEKMIFIFDTGAQTSNFYPPFFQSQKEQITKNYQLQKTGVGGVGGSQQVDSYVLKDISIEIGGKIAHFPKINLIAEVFNDQAKNYYGNLGQDLIKQFDKMTLDFEAMNITFE